MLQTIAQAMIQRVYLSKMNTERENYKEGSKEGFMILSDKTKIVNE